METLTKENKKQILGNKHFTDNEISLIAKLEYLKGVNYFDQILNGKSQYKFNSVIHIIKFPKAIQIKLAKLFNSYSIGIPYSDIIGIFVLKGSINKIKILCSSNQIEFSFKDSEYFDISNFFVEELNIIPSIVKNQNEYDSNKNIIKIEDKLTPDKKEIIDDGQKGKGWIIITGYIFAVFGGTLGFFIGLTLRNSKVKLKDGSKIKRYDESTRQHGDSILLLSFIMFIVLSLIVYLK